jgi:NitT/TauT family transport system substrate-binding protein
MRNKKIRIVLTVTISALMLIMVIGGSQTKAFSAPSEMEKLPKLVLVGPPGPMAIPLAYIVENERLTDVAEKTELLIWENPDQLRAIISGGLEGHFITMPSNSASIFYNKGMKIQLLDISVWGILYVISTDPEIATIEDLKGKEVVVPFQGNMPDLLFNYICQKRGIDTSKDLTIYYANSPQQVAQLILAGKKNYAVLTEPLATQVLLKGKKLGLNVYRSIDIQVEWGKVSGLGERIPIAGTVALPAIQGNTNVIKRFMEEYSLAVEWLKEDPAAAGILGSEIEQLGFEAKPVAESMKNTKWNFVSAKECKEEIQAFFGALMELNSKVIGGQLPGEGFYYEGVNLEK